MTVVDLAVVWENLEIDSQPKQRGELPCLNGVLMKKQLLSTEAK